MFNHCIVCGGLVVPFIGRSYRGADGQVEHVCPLCIPYRMNVKELRYEAKALAENYQSRYTAQHTEIETATMLHALRVLTILESRINPDENNDVDFPSD